MKIVHFEVDGHQRYGVLEGNSITEIEGKPYRHIKKLENCHKLKDVILLPPCAPTKIVAMGLNYYEHAKELGMKIPS